MIKVRNIYQFYINKLIIDILAVDFILIYTFKCFFICFFTVFFWFFFFFSARDNDTESFMLPYRVHMFFDITNTHTYVLIYLCLFPMFYASICHMAAICLLVILVFHICGELSILSYRIKTIGMQGMAVDRVRTFVQMHLKIIW